jgi:hypothetical protein
MGEWRHSSTILDLSTDVGEWSASCSSALPPGKESPVSIKEKHKKIKLIKKLKILISLLNYI